PIMILILLAVFQCTFTLGAYPQGWIDSGVNALCLWLKSVMAPGWFTSMLTDGVVQGVGSVLAFLPNIVIMFFFLSLLEDSGYMARAAFLMDKIMHLVGLHGRSFIPMLIGFGCNVPAIMAAKQIENRRDRTLTMLMIPFMSCSARLPVYLLFVSAFFPKHRALVMVSLYAIGILLSIGFAFVMKHTRWFRMEDEDYVSVLPPFRMPTWRNTGLHIWERVSDYLQKITTVILAASVIIWALEYFPADKTQQGANPEESYLASIGKAVAPVTEPLGFDWKMNVSLLTGLPAKEAIVSTMGILYHGSEDDSEGGRPLATVLREEKIFTPATSWAFMLFVLLYFPCVATVSAIRKEVGGKWAAFVVVNSLVLAWVMAFIAFKFVGLLL
ncbi:MAG: ferrous iron transport protein B, partial [Bacteroidales bacterium]|nr:ferrous iron transport protein B [Bacteroidales bacterium]